MRTCLRILPVLLLALTLSCCREKVNADPAFLASEDLGLTIAGKAVFSYDPLTCQAAFNRERRQFRLSTDTMSDYVIAVLSEIPAEKGQNLSADLRWTTERDIRTKKVSAFKVVKLESGKVWLWNNAEKIGLCVRILD